MKCIHGMPLNCDCRDCFSIFSTHEIRRSDIERTTKEKHVALVEYLRVKVDEKDWHGVSDAANDLRVLEAQHPELTK